MHSAVLPLRHRLFPALDGYRAIAALGVLVHHVAATSRVTSQQNIFGEITGKLGNYGVAVFFVLSGFLLYRPFVDASFRSTETPSWRVFWWRRALRIYPAYWVAVTAAFVLLDNRRPTGGVDQWISYYALVQNYRTDAFTGGLFVAWTLSIEVSFYLVLPLLAAALCRIGQRPDSTPTQRLRIQVIGLVALALFGTAWRWWAAVASPGLSVKPVVWLPTFFDWYALGMLVAVIYVWRDLGHPLPAWLEGFLRTAWPSLAVAVVLFALTIAMKVPNDFAAPAAETWKTVALISLNGLSACFLLLPGCLRPNEADPWRRALQTRGFVALGLISYGIFLWHPIAIDELNKWILQNRMVPAFFTALPIVLGFALLAATATYLGIERPAQGWRDLVRARRRPADTPRSDSDDMNGTAAGREPRVGD